MNEQKTLASLRRASRRGMVLIFVAGILTILAALGTAFFATTHSATLSAVRFSDMVRADLLARAGSAEAIVRLRNQAYIKTEDPGDTWFTVDYMRGARRKASYLFGDGLDNDPAGPDGLVDNEGEDESVFSRVLSESAGEESDRFTLDVTDAASKININACDNLAVVLDNLCRVIGPPLVPANLDALQPRRWADEADPADPVVNLYKTDQNTDDTATNKDLYYAMTDVNGVVVQDGLSGRPKRFADGTMVGGTPVGGTAIYGDGYAIAGFRARRGPFQSIEDVKNALTYVDRNGNGQLDDPLEYMEVAVKFVALRDHITIGSWVDTNTVCVGKFEWIRYDYSTGRTFAIDRDKSWVSDDFQNDKMNTRGSLRGCYLSIMNGHGAGQLRRIRTNGIDWVEVEPPVSGQPAFAVTPGPISSYMIIAPEESMLVNVDGTDSPYAYPDKPPLYDLSGGEYPISYPSGGTPFPVLLPKTKSDGTLVANSKINYSVRPLCIHRAPVNINTATDKVLAALFLGINVQHGHPQAVGTEANVDELRAKWKTSDPHTVNPYLLTPAGLKRIPAASGKPILDKVWGDGEGEVKRPPAGHDLTYINNNDAVGAASDWAAASTGVLNDAHELAYRIILARQVDKKQPTLLFIDPRTGLPTAQAETDYRPNSERGPFRNYDDLYFRVVKPWDDKRFAEGAGKKARLSTMLMANLNSNTDILKFNPNIEWIDRWSRNYSDQEPVMVYTNTPYDGNNSEPGTVGGRLFTKDVPSATTITASSVPICTGVVDQGVTGYHGGQVPKLYSSQRTASGEYIKGAYLTRSFRYKSDELIDKTDLNRSTTEFSFDSNGVFSVVSTGQVINRITGQLLAERKMESLVKVYDVWRESTQQQFVMGTLSKAEGDRTKDAQLSYTGQLARDGSGQVERKGLTTLPEPLLPLKARIVNPRNFEAVTSSYSPGSAAPLDAFGNVRKNPYDAGATAIQVPEVLANRVLPARWDGQIVLSTNTSSYDPSTNGDADTFLASFDGDTDTDTCEGNGREQAKWPYSAEPDGKGGYRYTGKGDKYRCVQSIGLLGVLNDTLISTDPGIPLVDGHTPFNNWADMSNVRWVYPFMGISSALMPLMLGADENSVHDRPMYWNNVSVRMGSLRTDGVYLTAPGVSGNTATLKYLFSPSKVKTDATPDYPAGLPTRHSKLNFQPDSVNGNLITMWAKTVWHQDDMRGHEFFNPGNESPTAGCQIWHFTKVGQYKWAMSNETGLGQCGNRRELNDLFAMPAKGAGFMYPSALHGGFAGLDAGSVWIYCADDGQSFALPGKCDVRYGLGGVYNFKYGVTGNITFNTATFGNLEALDWQWGRDVEHGGKTARGYYRPSEGPGNNMEPESPAYRFQPFRWSYVGMRHRRETTVPLTPKAEPWSPEDPVVGEGIGPRGHLADDLDWENETFRLTVRHFTRPFVDTALFPEGPTSWPGGESGGNGERLRWSFRSWNWHAQDMSQGLTGDSRDVINPGWDNSITDKNPTCEAASRTPNAGRSGEGQDVKWAWAEPYGTLALDPDEPEYSLKSFGMNNLNYGNPKYKEAWSGAGNWQDHQWRSGQSMYWHARHMPEDGTYAVIDEFKISSRDRVLVDNNNPNFNKDRAYREMRTSRYYLPPHPGERYPPDQGGPPTFTSQTLFESLRGHDTTPADQKVAVVRVNWNVFTPRFMAEYQEPDPARFKRGEMLTHFNTIDAPQAEISIPFKGPFDYVRYNDDDLNNSETILNNTVTPPIKERFYSVSRPEPWHYTDGLTQASRGVEIELLAHTGGDYPTITVLDNGKIFTVPSAHNPLGSLAEPVWCLTSQLRYRVRFLYPVDPLVDPYSTKTFVDGRKCVDPSKQYLLDTPVFDDISVTYILPARILDYREVLE